MGTETQPVKLPKPLIERLKERKHPGQSLSGIIEELLDEAERKQNADKGSGG
jgi:hypothetical protein